jgi:hypothetical protein
MEALIRLLASLNFPADATDAADDCGKNLREPAASAGKFTST